jgi:hypothetical protein
MMFLSEVNVPLIVEVALLIVVLVSAIIIGSVFIVRNLRSSFKELFRHQSKFDIELRKIVNLIFKATKNETMEKYDNLVIKDLPYGEKKALLDLVDQSFAKLEDKSEQFAYIRETYENLQEQRRSLDANILLFNQKISLFPFNLYAKVMKLRKRQYYTHK